MYVMTYENFLSHVKLLTFGIVYHTMLLMLTLLIYLLRLDKFWKDQDDFTSDIAGTGDRSEY